jgi:hypothetical protein
MANTETTPQIRKRVRRQIHAASNNALTIDLAETERRTGLRERLLRQYAAMGWAPTRRVGRRLVFCVADLEQWVRDGCPAPALPTPKAKR